ncbi:ribonuclease HIII [Cephaloticoccus primus]|uniref:Ribonuclease n=1 Tax=Cephaloticoccus primus TaxID=1548207 RepID=A0A139SRX0_9BACT|nr:ribonuclease HIII [Cephaloticoccus primus]KXU37339.1 ribonuclease HIII [Cephaloticoccus primus]
MAKRAASAGAGDAPAPKTLSLYTIKLDLSQQQKLRAYCESRGWERVELAYTHFAFKSAEARLNIAAYTSDKVVIAGKGTEDFVKNVLEPEITGEAQLGYEELQHPEWFEPHAGLDESGKGDFFGPLIAATVIANRDAIEAWREAGVQDSKKMTDGRIVALDRLIRASSGVVVRTCFCKTMAKYNALMSRPSANLNRLLGWQHAKALAEALKVRPVEWGLLDQFSEQPLVQRELRKFQDELPVGFELKMRPKAEADPVVAAASIIARAEYVRQMHTLSEKFGEPLQKGAGPLVKKQAAQIIEKFGTRALGDFAKLHFRTAYEVVADLGKLDELPLRPPAPKLERQG